MDKNNQDILNKRETKGRKDIEDSPVATEVEEKKISLSPAKRNDELSKKVETDFSHAKAGSGISHGFVSERKENRPRSEKDDDRISIVSPNDSVLEMQAQSARAAVEEKGVKRDISEKKRIYSSKSKTQKYPKGEARETKSPKKKTSSRKTPPQPVKVAPRPVVMSKGVAYLRGNMIKLVGGIKLYPGDEIRIKDKEFVLKATKKKKIPIYVSAVFLLIVGLILASSLLKSKNTGKLIGVVTEEKSGVFVPGAKIYLKEADKTVKSNELGFFMFESLPPGSYALKVSSSGYKSESENVTIAKDQSMTLRVNLTPLSSAELSSDVPAEVDSRRKSSPKKSSSGKSSTGSDYGAVGIKSNISDPVILIDDRLAGTGNDVYSNIPPGKHVIAVTKQGYYDWAQEVEIEPGKTLNLKVNLSEDKTNQPDAQTWKDFITLGNTQLNSNDFASALNSYNQALVLKPNSPDALLGRGYVYTKTGDRLKASEDYGKAAELFMQGHDYQKAAASYTNLITLDDRDPKSYLNRGICYLKLEENQESIRDLKKSVELDSDLFLGYLNLGQAYYEAGEYKPSIEAYKRAQKLNSESQLVFVGLTKAYFAKGDESKAKKSYEKFEKLATYIDREKLKQDSEWREVLEGIGVESQPKF